MNLFFAKFFQVEPSMRIIGFFAKVKLYTKYVEVLQSIIPSLS